MNKHIYLATYKKDGEPISSSDNIDILLEILDDWFGATKDYKFCGVRKSFTRYEYTEIQGNYYGEVIYSVLNEESEEVNIWIIPLITK